LESLASMEVLCSLEKGFFIYTMGCQMNEYDSDYLAKTLIRHGYVPVRGPGFADLILINSCTVRAKPEQKAVSLLGRMISLKRRNPRLILGLVGCLAQKEGGALLERFPDLDLIMGPREVGNILNHLATIRHKQERVIATGLDGLPPDPDAVMGFYRGKVSGFISIMQGCDNFCSYCAVPLVRGREVSRPPEKILTEARILAGEGIREITLLGQNVNSYRWAADGEADFVDLLREVSKVEGIVRLRFTTSHPKDLSPRLIQCFRDIENLCPHVHLPFQAGSNRVLERMRRGYTRETYLSLIQSLRDAAPDMAITSDVMVGFPGERDEDFQETMDLVKKVRFDGLFSFKYSDRAGTLAEKMGDKIDEQVKASRLTALQAIQREITFQKNKALEGKVVEVLVEGPGRRPGQITGRTDTNRVANFEGDFHMVGKLIKVMVKEGLANSLRGGILSHVIEHSASNPEIWTQCGRA
jgi:tRNA-2-methylthio-N6-dimethylallyladenosine synthase